MINDDFQTIFMINFEKYSFKIYKDQLFETLFIFRNFVKSTKMNFYFIDIFINKFKKESDISYIVDFLDEVVMFKTNISKH